MSIINEIEQEYLIYQDNLIRCSDFDVSVLQNGITIYEVVRVIDSTCLFFDDHIERFYKSLELSGFSTRYSAEEIQIKLHKLIDINNVKDGNIKYLFNINETSTSFLAYFMPHGYPSQKQYSEGVSAGIFKAERDNPNTKVWNEDLRKTVREIKTKNNYFEVLYQNRDGFMTEGSMSTLFFIKNNTVCTAPASMVLEGITRKYVFEVCIKLRIDIFESAVSENDISYYDAAFISGTSPKVLPIKNIERYSMNVNNRTLRTIIQGFDKEILESIT